MPDGRMDDWRRGAIFYIGKYLLGGGEIHAILFIIEMFIVKEGVEANDVVVNNEIPCQRMKQDTNSWCVGDYF